MHVFRARIGGVDPASAGTGMPIVDGRIVLHSGITAEVSALGNHTHQITGLEGVADFAAFDEASLPFTIVLYGLHKVIRDTDRVIGVLKEHATVGRTIQARIVSRFDQSPSLLLLFNFAFNKLLNIGMIH